MVLVLAGVLLLGACGGDEDSAADSSPASTTEATGEPIEIRTEVTIADEEGAETIATGEVLGGSTLGGSPFCVGGTILDTHPSSDPAEEPYLIERTITCPDGSVRIGLTPDVDSPPGEPQMGSWTIVSGTGDFDGVGGSGEMEVVYDPDDDSLARETLTGGSSRLSESPAPPKWRLSKIPAGVPRFLLRAYRRPPGRVLAALGYHFYEARAVFPAHRAEVQPLTGIPFTRCQRALARVGHDDWVEVERPDRVHLRSPFQAVLREEVCRPKRTIEWPHG